jgi:hypothetical protein
MKKSFKLVLGLFMALVALFAMALPDTGFVANAITDSGLDVPMKILPVAAVAKNELRERELIKKFRHEGTWLSRIPSKNNWVNNDTIRLNEMGADPAVLINNTTYPIPVNERTDASQAISLFKYDTENTKVSDDELYGLPYDKIGSVQMQHREVLEERTREHALHSLAPAENTANTPIIETSGELVAGRRRLIYADLVNLKTKMDKLKIPAAGRILVLSTTHLADLLLEDKALQVQLHNHTNGLLSKSYCGFELYEDVYSPKYVAATKVKIPFGAATAGLEASIVFHTGTTAQARGSVTAYTQRAADNPTMRETVLGFRLWFLAIPLRDLGQAAIVDATS